MESFARLSSAIPQSAGWSVVILAAAAAAGLLAGLAAMLVLARMVRHTESRLDDLLAGRCRWPAALAAAGSACLLALPLAGLEEGALALLRHALALFLVAAVAWLLLRAVAAFREFVALRYPLDAAGDIRSRQVRTQVRVLVRVVVAVVVVLAVGAALMTFEPVRQLGASILASAGIAGIVAGIAAQRTLANLAAGIQIAVTQPIRLEDSVLVEGEWGWIEEITLTYVVVRIWDLRRLVLPIAYFVERPFQNWTRSSANLLGVVLLHVDYSADVEAVRGELRRILEASPLWDRRVWGLQVTDATERTIELRAVVSAASAGDAWNLRCEVREKLLAFLQRSRPSALPRLRVENTLSATDEHG